MPSNDIQLLENSLLIADPSLHDGVFDRSVIHLADYSKDEGALGYIINRPTDKKVGEILRDSMFEPLKNIPVYFGGPVGTDHLVFSAYWWDEHHNFKYRLRVSAEEAVKMKRHPGSLLVSHVGHSSWQKGQLEQEIQEHVWVSSPVMQQTISVSPSQLWRSLLENMTPFHRLLAMTPEQPRKN